MNWAPNMPKRSPKKLQQRGVGVDVLASDRLCAGVPKVKREKDAPGAERDDEGGKLQARDQHAVHQAAKRAENEAESGSR